MNKKFMDRIKELRTEFGFTQEKLGNMLGITKTGISYWESGTSVPNDEMLINISNIFHVSIDYLLGKSDIRNINNENEDYRIAFDDIGKDYAELEDSEKDMIKTMIKAFKDKHQKK